LPLPAKKAGEAFMRSVSRLVQEAVERNVTRFVPPENVLRFAHGHSWNIGRSGLTTDSGGFETIRADLLVDKERVRSNDLGYLLEIVAQQAATFTEGSEQMLVGKADQAAEEAGNVLSSSEGSFPESFLEALKSVKFSANADGTVNRPSVLIHPDVAAKLEEELESRGPAYRLEVEAVKLEKSAEAVREELARLSKYEGFAARREGGESTEGDQTGQGGG
jgi:hypothetical protein